MTTVEAWFGEAEVLFKMPADGEASHGDGAYFCQGLSATWPSCVGVVKPISGCPFDVLVTEVVGLGDINTRFDGELVAVLEAVEDGDETLSDLAFAISISLAALDELLNVKLLVLFKGLLPPLKTGSGGLIKFDELSSRKITFYPYTLNIYFCRFVTLFSTAAGSLVGGRRFCSVSSCSLAALLVSLTFKLVPLGSLGLGSGSADECSDIA